MSRFFRTFLGKKKKKNENAVKRLGYLGLYLFEVEIFAFVLGVLDMCRQLPSECLALGYARLIGIAILQWRTRWCLAMEFYCLKLGLKWRIPEVGSPRQLLFILSLVVGDCSWEIFEEIKLRERYFKKKKKKNVKRIYNL